MTLEERRKKHEAALAKIKAQEAAKKQKAEAQKTAVEALPDLQADLERAREDERLAGIALYEAQNVRRKAVRALEQCMVTAGLPVRPRKSEPQGATSTQGEATGE